MNYLGVLPVLTSTTHYFITVPTLISPTLTSSTLTLKLGLYAYLYWASTIIGVSPYVYGGYKGSDGLIGNLHHSFWQFRYGAIVYAYTWESTYHNQTFAHYYNGHRALIGSSDFYCSYTNEAIKISISCRVFRSPSQDFTFWR